MKSSIRTDNKKSVLFEGMRSGIPIGLGYFAVSFSLGITAKNAGLSAFQSFLASLLCNASAGEYAVISLIAQNAAYIEIALITLVANLRYILMSCALSQRMSPDLSLTHRLIVGFDITDELFGITIARDGFIDPYFTYGAMITSIPFWCTGTMLGQIAGNLLPARIVSALSVALYGMFLAVIIPPARKSRVIACLIAFCFAASYAASHLPFISGISGGTRTIILTVVISAVAALLFPKKDEGANNDA